MDSVSCTVIIPSFNREALSIRALNSVLEQRRRPEQIIVINDGSTDPYFTLQRLAAENGCEFINQSNCGVAAARNSGIKMATCNWIAFLDSDDEWLPDKLERQYEYIDKSPDAKIIQCTESWFRAGKHLKTPDHLRPANGDAFERSLLLCCISASACIMHKSLVEKIGLFDEKLLVCEDYDYWIRALTFETIHLIDEPLVKKHGGGPMQLSNSEEAIDRFRVYSLLKYLTEPDYPRQNREMAKKAAKAKLDILINGATKRSLEMDARRYGSLMASLSGTNTQDIAAWINLLNDSLYLVEHRPKLTTHGAS